MEQQHTELPEEIATAQLAAQVLAAVVLELLAVMLQLLAQVLMVVMDLTLGLLGQPQQTLVFLVTTLVAVEVVALHLVAQEAQAVAVLVQ
jgi:hypothetical protein